MLASGDLAALVAGEETGDGEEEEHAAAGVRIAMRKPRTAPISRRCRRSSWSGSSPAVSEDGLEHLTAVMDRWAGVEEEEGGC